MECQVHIQHCYNLATMIGKYQGVDTPIFALSLIMAFVVMYDACGVRRAAGKQAALLNKIIETPGLTGVQVSEKLVEVLGHTPIQVIVGALIGVIVGLILIYFFRIKEVQYMTDIEIAKNVKLEKIEDIAKKLNIDEDEIEQYGKYKAKISNEVYEKIRK